MKILHIINMYCFVMFSSCYLYGGNYNPIPTQTITGVGFPQIAANSFGCLAIADVSGHTVGIYQNSGNCTLVQTSQFSTGSAEPSRIAFARGSGCFALADNPSDSINVFPSSGLCTLSESPFITGGTAPSSSIAYSSTGCFAAARNSLNTINTYTSGGGCFLTANSAITTGISNPQSVAFSPDAACLAVANQGNNTVTIYARMSGCNYATTPAQTLSTGVSRPVFVTYSIDGCLAVVNSGVGANSGSVQIYSRTAGGCASYILVSTLSSLNFPVNAAFNDDGSCLAIGNQAGEVSVYRKSGNCTYGTTPVVTIQVNSVSPITLFTQDECLVISNNAAQGEVTVYALIPLSLVIEPASLTLCQPGSIELSMVPTGGETPYTFSWNGPQGFTALTQSILIADARSLHSGTYTATLTDNENTQVELSAVVNVIDCSRASGAMIAAVIEKYC